MKQHEKQKKTQPKKNNICGKMTATMDPKTTVYNELGWKEHAGLKLKIEKGGKKKPFCFELEKDTLLKGPSHMDAIMFCPLKTQRKSSTIMELEFARLTSQAKENARKKRRERRAMLRLSRKCPVTLEDAKAMGNIKFEMPEIPERPPAVTSKVQSKMFFQQLKNDMPTCFEPVIAEPKI